jgi:hypothetical protein
MLEVTGTQGIFILARHSSSDVAGYIHTRTNSEMDTGLHTAHSLKFPPIIIEQEGPKSYLQYFYTSLPLIFIHCRYQSIISNIITLQVQCTE